MVGGMRLSWSIGLLALLFVAGGAMHFILPHSYEEVVPAWLPKAPLLVRLSGIAEIVGGLGLLLPATRAAAAWGLILLLLAVFPANVEMLRLAQAAGAARLWQAALALRLPLQGVLIWWVWRAALEPF